MIVMLCRNRVADAHADAHRAAGLRLRDLWRDLEEPNNVFFVFKVRNLAHARAFISTPAAIEAGTTSGVLEGEYHFLENSQGY